MGQFDEFAQERKSALEAAAKAADVEREATREAARLKHSAEVSQLMSVALPLINEASTAFKAAGAPVDVRDNFDVEWAVSRPEYVVYVGTLHPPKDRPTCLGGVAKIGNKDGEIIVTSDGGASGTKVYKDDDPREAIASALKAAADNYFTYERTRRTRGF